MQNLIRRAILSLALIAGIAPAIAQVPAPVPALPDTERRTTYSISGSLCTCSVGFQLYGDSTDVANWLEVFVNGALIPQAGNWTIASPTGPIATIPRPITDAVLTFTSAQTGTVQIVGARRPRRTSQFQESQPVPTRNFNQLFSDIIATQRELWDKTNDFTGRSVRTPPGETLNLLPILANRQNLGACFDSGGNLTSCASIPSSTLIAGNGITLTGSGPTTIAANLAAGTGIVITPGNPTTISAPTGSISFTQSGTGAVPVTANSIFAQTVTPQQFGALCNGTGDDGPAIQRAIDSTGTAGVVVQFSACVYRIVTGFSWTKNNVSLKCAAPGLLWLGGITAFDFEPSVDGILMSGISPAPGPMYETHFSDCLIFSNDTTHAKTAIKLGDVRQSSIRNITIQANGYWTGGTGGSTGLDLRGRDITTIENVVITADNPIHIGINPNRATNVADADHWVFRDLYLVANGIGRCIAVDDGVLFSNTTFEGRQSWVRCNTGFLWQNTSAPFGGTSSVNLSFSNIRTEQTTGGALTYTININQTAGNTLRGLVIQNSGFDIGARGMQLRGVKGATISNNTAQCGVPLMVDLDGTDDQIALFNNRFESGCTASIGTMIAMGAVANPTGSSVPAFVTYLSASLSSILTAPQTIATLPACGASNAGARAFVTDSNVTMTAGIGAGLGGGGANKTPVYCDGTIWRYGANDNIPVYLRRKFS